MAHYIKNYSIAYSSNYIDKAVLSVCHSKFLLLFDTVRLKEDSP